MNPTTRKAAADTRRVARKLGITRKDEIAQIRQIVHDAYARGHADGRRAEQEDLADLHPRVLLFNSAAGILDGLREQVAQIPDSERGQDAFAEAEAILRDAAEVTA